MNAKILIHVLAIIGLAVEASFSIRGFLNPSAYGSLGAVLYRVGASGFWGLLLWKVWKRPHKWGFGVGIFLLVLLALQTYLWILALPRAAELGLDLGATSYVLHELPLVVGGVCGILLKWSSPSDTALRT